MPRGITSSALEQHRLALAMQQGLYPKEKYPQGHSDLAASLGNVGAVLQAQGKYEEAFEHHRQASQMYESLFPKETYKQGHPLLAVSLSNVGTVLEAQGEYEQALTYLRRGLEMRTPVPQRPVQTGTSRSGRQPGQRGARPQ